MKFDNTFNLTKMCVVDKNLVLIPERKTPETKTKEERKKKFDSTFNLSKMCKAV